MTNFQSYLDISYDEQSSMNERQLLRNGRKELSGFKKLFFKRIHPKKERRLCAQTHWLYIVETFDMSQMIPKECVHKVY